MEEIKILIVDDEPGNLLILVNAIESAFPEAEVLQALNAKMAMFITKETLPSLIITDWEMPGMSGIELITALKADESTRDIPILMCTGIMVSKESLRIALEAGASDYVRKPVDVVELTARVGSMLKLAQRTQEIIEQKRLHDQTRLELERERAERSIQKAIMEKDRAQASEEMKKRFFSQLTHEFRTPLTLIMGPLEEIVNETLESKTRRHGEFALRNSKILLRLINQLLELSRLEGGHVKIRPETRDLMEFVGQKVEGFQPLSGRKEIKLEMIGEQEVLEADFDPDAMEKVLNNLLSNAIKFTPQKGSVTVRVGMMATEDGWLKISVKDSGIGIATEKLPFIFDRFYQVDGEKTTEQEGTGLGLALVKELVELHGGEIKVMSLEGLGSEFTVVIPRRQEGAQPGETAQLSHTLEQEIQMPDSSTESEWDLEEEGDNFILLVEDNHDIREYVRLALEPAYKVIEAADGLSGIEKAREFVPNLIVSDVMMPGADGFEVCAQVKSDEKTSHIPVILLTAKSNLEDRIEGLETGADAYLSKPFNTRELLVQIKNLIAGRQKLKERFRKEMITAPVVAEATSLEDQFLQRLRDIMTENLADETFSVEDLAAEMAMSRTQLHRKLKALTDQAASEYMRNFRLEIAYQLLEKNAGSIGEIAFQVGFASASYFSKSFAARYGKSPKEVRKG